MSGYKIPLKLLVKAGKGDPSGLINWFNNGADGQIDWGSPGDFMQCVDIASEHMDDEQAKGFCNLRHQDAVGGPPGSEGKVGMPRMGFAFDPFGRRLL